MYAATRQSELDALLSALPVPMESGQTRSTDMVPADAPAQRAVATFSGQERKLMAVPRRLDVQARFGYVELDLREAAFSPGVTEIDVWAFAGYAKVYLPAGVRIESTGRGVFGFFAERDPAPRTPTRRWCD